MYDTRMGGNWYKADEPWGAFLQGEGNPAVTIHREYPCPFIVSPLFWAILCPLVPALTGPVIAHVLHPGSFGLVSCVGGK